MKFNVLNGADSSTVQATIEAADAKVGDLVVGSDTLLSSDVTALEQALDNYNNGVTGPRHCQ